MKASSTATVSQPVISEALAVLRDEGVVFTTPGLGAFVAQKGEDTPAEHDG